MSSSPTASAPESSGIPLKRSSLFIGRRRAKTKSSSSGSSDKSTHSSAILARRVGERGVELSVVVPVHGCRSCLSALYERLAQTLGGITPDVIANWPSAAPTEPDLRGRQGA